MNKTGAQVPVGDEFASLDGVQYRVTWAQDDVGALQAGPDAHILRSNHKMEVNRGRMCI